MSTSDDDKSHIEELHQWADNRSDSRGRKLIFSEQCGIAWALKVRGVKAKTIQQAFGLTPATVSWLKNCLAPDRLHYRDVWAEYQRLGPERFEEKHYTRDLHFRLKRVARGLTHLDDNKIDIAPRPLGPDPDANKYAGEYDFEHGGGGVVMWRDGDQTFPQGWYFGLFDDDRQVQPHHVYGHERLRGADGHEPFARSHDALDGLYETNGYESPRPKPGRPKSSSSS